MLPPQRVLLTDSVAVAAEPACVSGRMPQFRFNNCVACRTQWYWMFIIFIPSMFLLLPHRMILIGETQGFLRSIRGRCSGGIMGNCCFSCRTQRTCCVHGSRARVRELARFAPMAKYRQLPRSRIAVATARADGSQRPRPVPVGGNRLGRKKLVPLVSPGKTLGRPSGESPVPRFYSPQSRSFALTMPRLAAIEHGRRIIV